VFLTALIARHLLGMHLLDTGGSILAAGVQHASWNAAQKLEAVEGGDWDWQMVTAVALLTLLLAVGRRIRVRRPARSGRKPRKSPRRSGSHHRLPAARIQRRPQTTTGTSCEAPQACSAHRRGLDPAGPTQRPPGCTPPGGGPEPVVAALSRS